MGHFCVKQKIYISLYIYYTSYAIYKTNLKCIIKPNAKWKTIKHLEGNISGNINNLGFGDKFLDMTTKA